MATLRSQDLVGRRVDRPHAAAAQLLLQEEPLVERRADPDHRQPPTVQPHPVARHASASLSQDEARHNVAIGPPRKNPRGKSPEAR